MEPILRCKKLSPNATIPTRGSPLVLINLTYILSMRLFFTHEMKCKILNRIPQAAGYDLSAAEDTVVPARGKAIVKTDLVAQRVGVIHVYDWFVLAYAYITSPLKNVAHSTTVRSLRRLHEFEFGLASSKRLCKIPHPITVVQAIAVPPGTYGRVAPRSGLAWKNHIDVGAGKQTFQQK
jgi:hypothetical protein